jgi:very-short-patch-repair endonuclease
VAFAERNSQRDEQGLRELLARPRGLVTNAQLADLGFVPSAITRRVRIGELERVLPRVYRSRLVAPTVAQGVLAATLWAGKDSVASHATAATLWKISEPRPDAPIELWVPGGRAARDEIRVHRGSVTGNDRRLVGGVPVTSPARTIVDMAGVLEGEALESALESVLHRGLTTASALERTLTALGGKGRSGSAQLQRLLHDRDQAPLESRLEVKVWRLLRQAGLRPVRQYRVACRGQRYRLDFAWPRLKVAVAANGFRAHRGRIAHVSDHRRLADLVGDGWRIVPVTWEDCVHEPQRFVDRVRAALLRAA